MRCDSAVVAPGSFAPLSIEGASSNSGRVTFTKKDELLDAEDRYAGRVGSFRLQAMAAARLP
jgi:hypothetical protein